MPHAVDPPVFRLWVDNADDLPPDAVQPDLEELFCDLAGMHTRPEPIGWVYREHEDSYGRDIGYAEWVPFLFVRVAEYGDGRFCEDCTDWLCAAFDLPRPTT